MPTSDTVCEPLEGFYCTDEYRNSCRYAVVHTQCSHGQYTKQKGWCNTTFCKSIKQSIKYWIAWAWIIYFWLSCRCVSVGTAVKDAECAVCADGTYFNGSLQICKQHTKWVLTCPKPGNIMNESTNDWLNHE